MFSAGKELKVRAVVFGAIFLLLNLWFMLLERVVQRPTYIMYTAFDSRIPFVPQFIVPYYIWHIYVYIPMIWLFFKSPEQFVRGLVFYSIALLITCLIYTLAPNGQRLRPQVLGDSFFERWVAFTYSVDSPNNVAPSLHVLDSIAMHATLIHSAQFRRYKPLKWVSGVICFACSVSTVFVKQHSIIDVVMGAVIGLLIYIAMYSGLREWLAAQFGKRT